MRVFHQFNVFSLENMETFTKMKMKNENEKCYLTILAFFCENVEHVDKSLVELLCAKVGFETLESRSFRFPACCSFEADFEDGTVRSFLDSEEPDFFDALVEIISLTVGVVEKDDPCVRTSKLLSLQVIQCTSPGFVAGLAAFAGSRRTAWVTHGFGAAGCADDCAAGGAAGCPFFLTRVGCFPGATCEFWSVSEKFCASGCAAVECFS